MSIAATNAVSNAVRLEFLGDRGRLRPHWSASRRPEGTHGYRTEWAFGPAREAIGGTPMAATGTVAIPPVPIMLGASRHCSYAEHRERRPRRRGSTGNLPVPRGYQPRGTEGNAPQAARVRWSVSAPLPSARLRPWSKCWLNWRRSADPVCRDGAGNESPSGKENSRGGKRDVCGGSFWMKASERHALLPRIIDAEPPE